MWLVGLALLGSISFANARQTEKITRIGYLASFGSTNDSPAKRQLAAELLRPKSDVLIASDPTAIRAAKQATQIVMITNQDPVAAGFVKSLARPGGNVTGITRLTRAEWKAARDTQGRCSIDLACWGVMGSSDCARDRNRI